MKKENQSNTRTCYPRSIEVESSDFSLCARGDMMVLFPAAGLQSICNPLSCDLNVVQVCLSAKRIAAISKYNKDSLV